MEARKWLKLLLDAAYMTCFCFSMLLAKSLEHHQKRVMEAHVASHLIQHAVDNILL